jgi:AcrR family transcriptional regulator
MPADKTSKGARTREHLYRTALTILRKRGYERATMREIARAAGMSLGASYHYFASKDAIVMAYYEESQRLHDVAVHVRWSSTTVTTFADRLDAIFQTKIDAAAGDRKLLGVLFRSVGDPRHPLSPLSRNTARIRDRNVALFEALLVGEPAGLRRSLSRALWLVELGLLLYFIYDRSNGKRTRQLAHDVARQIGQALPLLRSPLAQPFLAQLDGLFGRARRRARNKS